MDGYKGRVTGAGGRETSNKKAKSKRAPFPKNRKGMRHPNSSNAFKVFYPPRGMRREERFLSARANPSRRVKGEERLGLLQSK